MDMSPVALWEQMTWLARLVTLLLAFLSIYSGYVMLERYLYFRKARAQSLTYTRQVAQLLSQDKAQEAVASAGKFPGSHVARVTKAGLIEFLYDKSTASGLTGEDMIEAARRAIDRETLITAADQKKGIGSLATIATTAPFIGLFGTVIGIINAFRGMAVTGSGGLGAVSAGIAEALVTTAFGLFVAIPAAWMFNYYTNVLERFQSEMFNASSVLVDYFIKKHGGSHAVGVRV